jgi:hypothetical protein
MNLEQMRGVLAEVAVPDFEFEIFDRTPAVDHCLGGSWPSLFYLRGHYKEGDIVTGDVLDQYTRKWLLSEHMVKSELVQTAFKCYLTSRDKDAYSAFDGTSLEAMLRSRNIDTLWIGGLATDFCVRDTVLDALRLGFRTSILMRACRAVNVDNGNLAISEMMRAGAEVMV